MRVNESLRQLFQVKEPRNASHRIVNHNSSLVLECKNSFVDSQTRFGNPQAIISHAMRDWQMSYFLDSGLKWMTAKCLSVIDWGLETQFLR